MKKTLPFVALCALLAGCGGDGSPSAYAGSYVGTADITTEAGSAGGQTGVVQKDAATTATIDRYGAVKLVTTYDSTTLVNTVPTVVGVTETTTGKVSRGALAGVLQTSATTGGSAGWRYDGRGGAIETSEGLLTVGVVYGDENGRIRYAFRLRKATP